MEMFIGYIMALKFNFSLPESTDSSDASGFSQVATGTWILFYRVAVEGRVWIRR